MSGTILIGDCREQLATLPERSVHCCVTSPPYWGLRDYGVQGQLGLEPTPEQYVANMVAVFRAVWRVLRDDGTLWLNLGDSYASGGSKPGRNDITSMYGNAASLQSKRKAPEKQPQCETCGRMMRWTVDGWDCTHAPKGYKPKDLVGIPWRVALALQQDGWFLRSDIIWAKPNPMPESVTDRPTSSHEYMFLFAKGQRKTRVVALADLDSEFVHLRHNFGAHPTYSGACQIAVSLASAILDRAESEYQLSLPPLYAKVWQDGRDNGNSDGVGALPVIHRAAMLSARLLTANASAKQFLSELYGLGVALSDSDDLLIGGGAAILPLPPGIYRDGKTAIGIHHSGQVSKFEFCHGTIVTETPSRCNYYYDAEAVKEPSVRPGDVQTFGGTKCTEYTPEAGDPNFRNGKEQWGRTVKCGTSRNLRTVWTILTQPFRGDHYAAYPEALVVPCIKAGTSERGCCHECGAPWERVVEKTGEPDTSAKGSRFDTGKTAARDGGDRTQQGERTTTRTVGWRPTCSCDAGDPVPCTVLDPFLGAGTTGLVAAKLQRNWIGCELNPEYAEMARLRIDAGGDMKIVEQLKAGQERLLEVGL